MSRQIDLTKPLSDEDRQYLVDWSRTDDLRKNAEYLAEQDAAALEPIDDGNTGDVNPFEKDDGSDLMAGTHPGERAVTESQRQAVKDLQSEDPNKVTKDGDSPLRPTQQAGDAESEHDDNYDDADAWSYRDLQKEIGERNEDRDEDSKIPASGSREDLVARLRADDAEG